MEEKDNNISNGSGTDWQKILNDFNKTYANHQDASDEKLFSAFPEFGGDAAKLKAAKDYYATTAKHSDVPLEQINAKFPEFFGSADAVAETPKKPVKDGKKYASYADAFNQNVSYKPFGSTDAKETVVPMNPYGSPTAEDVMGYGYLTYENSEDYVADPLEKQSETEKLEKMLLEKDAPERDVNGNVRKSPKAKYKGEERAAIQAQIDKNNSDIEKFNKYVEDAVRSSGAPAQYENAEQVYEYARKSYDKMKSGLEKKRKIDSEVSELYAEMMDKFSKGEVELDGDYSDYMRHISQAEELNNELARLSSIDTESLDEQGRKAYIKEAQRYNAEMKAWAADDKKYGDDFKKNLEEKIGNAFEEYYNQNKAKTVDENGNEVGLYEYEYNQGFNKTMGKYISDKTLPFKVEQVVKNYDSVDDKIAKYVKEHPSQMIGVSPTTGIAVYSHGPEDDKITQAVSIQHESKGMIDAYNKGGMKQLAKGFGNKITDFDIYTFGITDAIGNNRLKKISEKIDAAGDFSKGYDELTDAEKILWDAYMENGLVLEYLSSGINAGYRAGQTTAEMIPFMVQMALTEGIATQTKVGQWAMKKGLYSAAEKGGARALQSAAAEAATKKTFGAAVKDFAVKGLKEGTIKGAIGASTIGAGNVAANATERMLGTAIVDIDPIDGKITYEGQTGQEKDWKAWTLAYLGQTLEMQSEMTGEYIMGMFKPLASGVFGGMLKDGNKFFPKMFNALKSNKYANALGNIRRATFTGGSLEEFSEEMWRNLEGAIIGETEWSSFSKENLLETAYGLLPAQILFGCVNMGGAVKHTVRAAKARKALDSKNPELVERYDKVMNAGTYAAQDFISGELSRIMNGKGEYAKMDDAQKAASVEYLLSMQEKTYMDEYAALEGDKAKKDYLHEMTRRVNLNSGGVSFVEATDAEGKKIIGTLESTNGDKSVVMDYSGKRHEVSTQSVEATQTYTEIDIEKYAKDIAEQAGIDLTLYDVSGLFSGDTAMNDGETVLVGGLTATVESVDENGNYTVRYENADGEAVRTMTHSERELREILTQGVDEEAELQGDIEGSEMSEAMMTSEVANSFGEDEETSLLSMRTAMDMGRTQRMALNEMRKQFSDEEIAAFDAMDARQKARYILSLDDSSKAKAAWNYVNYNYGSMGDAIGRRKQRAFDDAVRRLNDYGINGTAETATYNGNTVVVKGSTGTMAVVDDLMGNAMTVDASELQDSKPMTVEELATMITADEENALDMLGEIYNGTFFTLGETVVIGVDENGKMIDGVVTGVDADGNVTYTVGKEQFTESKAALRDKKEAAEAQYAEMQQRRVEEEYKKRKADGVKSGDEISIMVDSQENGKKTRKKIRVSYQGKTGGTHTMYTLDGDEVISMSDEEFKKAYVEAANMEDTQAAQAQPEQAQEQQEQPKQQEQQQESVQEEPNVDIESEYQTKVDEIRGRMRNATAEEMPALRAELSSVVKEYLDKIKTMDAVVLNEDNYEKLLAKNGVSASVIANIKKKFEYAKRTGQSVNGFHTNGKVFIFSDFVRNIDFTRSTYVHERQHDITKKNVFLLRAVANASTLEELERCVEKLSRSTFYTEEYGKAKNGKEILADEFISFAMELAYNGEDVESALRRLGINNDNLLSIIKQLDNEQRNDDSLSKARRRQGSNLHVDDNREEAGRQDGGNSESRPAEVVEQGLRPDGRSGSGTQQEVKEKSVTERLDDFVAKHGENAENKLNKTVKAQQTEIASLTKQLAERMEELKNMAEPYDEKSQKAEDKKKKQIARLEEYLANAEQRIAPWVEMQEEMGRRKAEAEAQALQYQANENAAQAALDDLQQSLDDALVAKPTETADDEPTNAMEFIAKFIRSGKLNKGENLSINAASFDKHTGYGAKERKPFVGLFKKSGGVTMEQLGEMLYDEAQSQGYGSFFTDAQDAFNKALGFFQEVQSIGDIYRYVNENRKAQQDEELNYIQSQIESAAQAQGYESSQAMYDDIMEQGRNLVEMARDENGNIDTESLAALQELMEALKPKFDSEQTESAESEAWEEQTDYVPFSITPAMDAEYMEAVNNGDMDKAQRMVVDAAKKSGYDSSNGYQGSIAFNGAAPSKNGYFETSEERKEAFDNGDFEGEQSLGDYIKTGLDNWDLDWMLKNPIPASGRDYATLSSIRNINSAIRKGNGKIKMYRAVDSNIKENSFRNGDWITPSREYAERHIGLQDWEEGRIIEQEVSVDDIWWDGNDINEWGYDDGIGYGYRNTENNRKLLDPITYDDNGNIIPLSERFNPENNDIRFSINPIFKGVIQNGVVDNELVEKIANDDKIKLTRLPERFERSVPYVVRAAQVIARASYSTYEDGKTFSGSRGGYNDVFRGWVLNRRNRGLIEEWAKANSYWFDDARLQDGYREIEGGTESRVFVSDDGSRIRKLTSFTAYGNNLQRLTESVSIFNESFPETAYNVIGYGRYKGDLALVVEQPFVDGIKPDREQVLQTMSRYGFSPTRYGESVFEKDGIFASDINEDNIVYNNGKGYVIDAVMSGNSIYDEDFVRFSITPEMDADFRKAYEEGDTEKAAELVKKAAARWMGLSPLASKSVSIVNADAQHGFKNFAEARKWAKENIVGEYENNEIGKVNISSASIDKYLSRKAVDKSTNKEVHLSALRVMPQIIESSIIGEIHNDRDRDSNIKDIVRLFGAIIIDGTTYRVKTTVKRYNDSNTKTKAYSYEVTEIELLDGESGASHTTSADSTPTSSNSISAAKLLKGVDKSDGSGKIIPDDASKVVDENGYPLVVYHGTLNTDEKRVWNDKMKWYDTEHSRFNVFKRVVDGERNKGHFFVSEKVNAEGYGDLYSVFLNISNPLVIDANNQTYNRIEFNGKTDDTYGWAEYAEKNGHDGVIFNNVRDGVDYGSMEKSVNEYVAFYPSQIKSAEPFTFDDNDELIPLSERFNAENDDIRFSTIPLPDPTSEEAYEPDALTERFSVALGSNPASIDYDKEVSSKFFKMYSALFDGAIALKRMQSAVARGTEIGEFENPYLMEIARVSRTAAENERLEPLTDELKDAITAFLRERGIGQAEWYDQDMRRLSTYAICKHGVIDRNPCFYEIALAKREEENQAAYEKYESRFDRSAKEYEESLQEEYDIYSRYNKTPRMSYDEWLKAKHDASYKGYLSWMKANKPNETPLGYDEYIESRNERARDLRIEYNAYLKYDKQQPMTYDEWLAAKWNRSYRGYLAWMKANRPGEDVLELDEYKDLKTPKKLTYDEFAAKRNARLGEVIPEDNAGLTAIAEEIDPSVNRKHEKVIDGINDKINNINADIEILKGQIEKETDEDEIDRMEAELEQLKADRKALNKQLADEKKSYYNELMAISNSEVLAYENEFGTDKTDRLWNAINAISAEIRDHWREGGIVSKEAYDEMQRRFKYYIPLRGFDEKTTADEYAYQSTPSVQQRFEGFKKMEGRTSRAADPFSTILRMLDSAVDAHYKNDVGKAVFNLALNHKGNGLLYTAKVWEVRDEKTGQWVASEPEGITQGMSGTQIERIIKNHESEMKALAKRGAARPIQYINGKKLPKDAEQHHRLKVMIDGKPVYVFIAGNTNAFDALNRKSYGDYGWARWSGSATRFMSRLMTTYKPSFIIRNAMKDRGTADFVMYSQGGWKYMRNFDKNWRLLLKPSKKGLVIRRLTKGTCEEYVELNGQQVRLQDLFDEFYTNGGETGYTRTLSQEAKHKELETELRRMTRKGANRAKDWPMMGIRAVGEYMEDVNRYAEDLSRFSIYVTARQNGKSITDAVADAKNGTANFSKKGDSAFAAFMNRNFAFFNASLQGFNTFAHSFKGEGKWRAVGATASLTAMGVMLPIVNVLLLAFNGDDDDWATYENLSQYVTNTNFTLFIPGLHKFITVPYPQELVPVMALGNIIARNTMGMTSPADDDTIFGNITMQWISTVADLMPVNPLETLLDRSYNSFGEILASASRPLAPTYLSPIYDVVINRNFMGGEVRHKHYTQYNERDDNPYWVEADARKMPLATLAARIIAGNDPYEANFFNADPRQIEHVIKGYSNGVGDIIGEQIKTVSSILNGTFDTNSIPIVRKFIISPTPMKWDGQVTSKLYDIADEIDRTKKERKKIEKRIDKALNDGKDASKYLEELRELENSLPYILYDKFGDMNKTMKDFNEQKANIMANENYTNEERNAKLEELSKEKLILLDMASDAAEDWRKENKKIDPPAKIRKAIYGSYGTEDKDKEQNND